MTEHQIGASFRKPDTRQENDAIQKLVRELDLYPGVAGVLLAERRAALPEKDWRQLLRELGVSPFTAELTIRNGEVLRSAPRAEREAVMSYVVGFLTEAVVDKVCRLLGISCPRQGS